MAITPQPRSRNQILGSMIESFCSDYGLNNLKVGGPVLSFFDSVSQSQFRNSEDIFTLLAVDSLDFTEKGDLDNVGNSEGVPRYTESPAFGACRIDDTAFQKIATAIYQGTPAPIVGSAAINVANGSSFPSSGSIYLGRGTSNYEGPLPYTSCVNNGAFWTITLSTPTLRFHNLNETVVLAQGGERPVSAGSICQTLLGGAQAATQFKVLYGTKIPDGETSVSGITVVCTKPGLSGNVSLGAIRGFKNPIPNTLTITNTSPFNNGQATEDDESYRERIRAARKTRVKGTPLAIKNAAVGTLSPDDNKRVLSATFVTSVSKPATLYIDDGTGYEEESEGVAIESLIDEAFGGEDDFQVSSQPPITKAHVVTTMSAPFSLADGMKLAFDVGGVTTEHTLSATQFRAIGNATGYELVASVNGDSGLNWTARTLSSGTKVAFFAKADKNESIRNVAPQSGIDANPYLGCPGTRVDTTRLYKNDRLLNKDGSLAIVMSNAFSTWATLSGAQGFALVVDGITLKFDNVMFPKFSDADFAAYTSFPSLGNNTPDAWVAVFNNRIPGITATVTNGLITITSNRMLSGSASVEVLSSDLVSGRMFNLGKSVGANNDYEINRNTGKIQLVKPLSAGDSLSLGSLFTRAFVQTPAISTITLASNANLWFSVDGAAQVVSTGVSPSTGINITQSVEAWGYRTRFTSAAAAALFSKVAVGDWAVCWDAVLIAAGISGAYRVAAIDTAGTWIEIETAGTVTTGAGILLANAGLQVVRSSEQLLHVTIPSGTNYTATSLVTALNAKLHGASASVYRTTALRIQTNTFNDTASVAAGLLAGDIALVAADVLGQQLNIPISSALPNLTGHMASVESANSECGTPDFHTARVNSSSDKTHATVAWSPDAYGADVAPSVASQIVGIRAVDTGTTSSLTRYGSNKGFHSPLFSVVSNAGNWDLVMEDAVDTSWVPRDRIYFAQPFAFTPQDSLTVVVDGDVASKRYGLSMGRTIKPTSGSYASTNEYVDADNGNRTLAVGFGLNFDFDDFAVWMAARAKMDSGDATKSTLWRYNRLGPDGNHARIRYQNPAAPNAPVGFSIENLANKTTDIGITLAGGAARVGLSLHNTTKVGYAVSAVSGGMATIAMVLGLSVSAGTRIANSATLTLTLPAGITNHGLGVGNVIYVNSTDPNYPSGAWTITAVDLGLSTITYTDTSASVAVFSGTATVSNDSTGEASIAGGSVATGDFFVMKNNPSDSFTGLTAPTMRITSAFPQYVVGKIPWNGSFATNVIWGAQLNDPANFQIFQNPAQTATAIVAAFNALPVAPLKGTVLGTGAGIIDRSSDETAGVKDTYTSLTDGINYVATTTDPATLSDNYQFTFKNDITAGLATGADWANEVVKLVPMTAKNVVDWMTAAAVSGLFTSAEVKTSSGGRKVQLSSLTPGSKGSLQVQGGSANSSTAVVLGSSSIAADNGVGTMMISTVAAANASGFAAGHFVRVDNATTLTKSIFDTNTKLASVTHVGSKAILTFDNTGTAIWTQAATPSASVALLIEKQGAFVALQDTGLATALTVAGAAEGDWIKLSAPATATLDATRQIAQANVGMFRVVRVVTSGTGGACVWIENANALEQGVAECDVKLLKYDSLVKGDIVSISAPLWGAGNRGTWTVTSVGESAGVEYTDRWVVALDASTKSPQLIGAPVGALGAQSSLVLAFEGTPGRYFKQIYSIIQNQDNSANVDIKFTSSSGVGHINAAAGSVITALDKLGFSTSIAQGIDGYQRSIGLMAEVNRVLYGDASDPATYPGVVAGGAVVNTSGPLIKRIQISVLLRLRSGANRKDITEQAQSSIAAVINKNGQGVAPSLIDIGKAAKVPGVVSVVLLSPLATAGSDVIPVQPYEKPMVLNPATDILISFVGG